MRTVFLVLLAASLAPAYAEAAETAAEKSTAKRISSHIQKSGQLRDYRIGVTYQNGVAVLAGTVTSPEQRETATRLAEQVPGVKRVECKLQCANKSDAAPAANNQREITNNYVNAGENVKTASLRNEPIGGFVQARSDRRVSDAPTQQRPTMQTHNSARMSQQRPVRRNNMPLPSPRYAADPAIRQASAQGCYPAGGPCADGYPGMGPGMGGGMGPGMGPAMGTGMGPQAMPTGVVPTSYGRGPSYENPQMPGYAWPSYASYPNYAALSYPQQYSPTAWPYIGPFYPYPQVPLAWRKVSLEWDDGWWFLDFSSHNSSH